MKLLSAGIVGLGTFLPEKVLSNYDLEKMLDTSDEWIISKTGIRERRIALPEQATSDLAFEAAKRALEDAGVEPEEIDLIIVATVTPDMLFPATACIVQEKLGAFNAGAFDLEAGCTGFIYAVTVGAQFINNGIYKNVLVIGADILSKITNWEDRSSCILFGDGAGAAVLKAVPEARGIKACHLGADGKGGHSLHMPAGGSRMPISTSALEQRLNTIHMNGPEVYKFAVRTLVESTRTVLKKAGLTLADLDLLIPHQANLRIIEGSAKKLGLSDQKLVVNIDRCGNTSSASIPLALNEALSGGKLKDGDNVVLVGFGSGLTWGAIAMSWFDYKNK